MRAALSRLLLPESSPLRWCRPSRLLRHERRFSCTSSPRGSCSGRRNGSTPRTSTPCEPVTSGWRWPWTTRRPPPASSSRSAARSPARQAGIYKVSCVASKSLGEASFQMSPGPSLLSDTEFRLKEVKFFPTGPKVNTPAERDYQDRFSSSEATRIGIELTFLHPGRPGADRCRSTVTSFRPSPASSVSCTWTTSLRRRRPAAAWPWDSAGISRASGPRASTWPSARSMDAPSRWSASRSGESATGDPGADGIVEALESLQTEGIGGDTGRQRRLLGNALGERK